MILEDRKKWWELLYDDICISDIIFHVKQLRCKVGNFLPKVDDKLGPITQADYFKRAELLS